MTALTAATNLLDRIRDTGGLSLSSNFPPSLANGIAYAKTLISVAQRCINTIEQNQLVEISYTLTQYQTLYEIDADPILGTGGTNPIIKMIAIQDTEGRDILECPFQQIYAADFGWFRRQGLVQEAWARVGRDCWVIYPGTFSTNTVVTIVAVPYLADLVADSDLLSVTDDLISQVQDLAEALALFKLGQYKLAMGPLGRLQEQYKAELAGDQWRKQMSSLT